MTGLVGLKIRDTQSSISASLICRSKQASSWSKGYAKPVLKIEIEARVYITSAAAPADKLAAVICQHRATENSLHLGIDMVFRDDGCRISSGCAPSNFTTE